MGSGIFCLLVPLHLFAVKVAVVMKQLKLVIAVLVLLVLASCATGKKPNQGAIRQRIEQLGLASLESKQLQIVSVAQERGDSVVVETNVSLAMKLSKSKNHGWQIDAVRLGDRDWLDMAALMEALNEVRARQTRQSLDKLGGALRRYRQANGGCPQVNGIDKLTDLLAPGFMPEVIRFDGWNRPLIYEWTKDGSCSVLSLGPDGKSATADDLIERLEK